MEYDIEKINTGINYEDNMHKQINKMWLSSFQIKILEQNSIPYEKCITMSELLFYIDEYLNDFENPELELIAKEIAETNYYINIKK